MVADLRLLRYFLTVARTLHFGRAAEELFISQPALSQQVRKLESDLGVRLLERDHRSVSLTDAGSALIAPAQAAVAAGEEFVRHARSASRQVLRELVVGYHTRWPGNALPTVIRAYAEVRPDVQVRLEQHTFADTSAGLRTGSTDVALLHLPISGAGLQTRTVGTEPRVVMLADDHPLSSLTSVTVADLVEAGTPWAVPPDDDPEWRDFWSAALERAAVGGTQVPTVQPLTQESLFQVVAGGGALVLTYAAVEEVYRPPGVRFVPVAGLEPATLAVAWRSDDNRADVAHFVGAVSEVMRTTST